MVEPVCCFCQLPADKSSWKDLGALKHTAPSGGEDMLYYHEPCAVFSLGTKSIPEHGLSDEQVRRLHTDAYKTGRRVLNTCAVCRQRGATPGCCEPHCERMYHYPCARKLAFQGEVVFSTSHRDLACSGHQHKLQGLRETVFLGEWFEGDGGWHQKHQADASKEWLPSLLEHQQRYAAAHGLTCNPLGRAAGQAANAPPSSSVAPGNDCVSTQTHPHGAQHSRTSPHVPARKRNGRFASKPPAGVPHSPHMAMTPGESPHGCQAVAGSMVHGSTADAQLAVSLVRQVAAGGPQRSGWAGGFCKHVATIRAFQDWRTEQTLAAGSAPALPGSQQPAARRCLSSRGRAEPACTDLDAAASRAEAAQQAGQSASCIAATTASAAAATTSSAITQIDRNGMAPAQHPTGTAANPATAAAPAMPLMAVPRQLFKRGPKFIADDLLPAKRHRPAGGSNEDAAAELPDDSPASGSAPAAYPQHELLDAQPPALAQEHTGMGTADKPAAASGQLPSLDIARAQHLHSTKPMPLPATMQATPSRPLAVFELVDSPPVHTTPSQPERLHSSQTDGATRMQGLETARVGQQEVIDLTQDHSGSDTAGGTPELTEGAPHKHSDEHMPFTIPGSAAQQGRELEPGADEGHPSGHTEQCSALPRVEFDLTTSSDDHPEQGTAQSCPAGGNGEQPVRMCTAEGADTMAAVSPVHAGGDGDQHQGAACVSAVAADEARPPADAIGTDRTEAVSQGLQAAGHEQEEGTERVLVAAGTSANTNRTSDEAECTGGRTGLEGGPTARWVTPDAEAEGDAMSVASSERTVTDSDSEEEQEEVGMVEDSGRVVAVLRTQRQQDGPHVCTGDANAKPDGNCGETPTSSDTAVATQGLDPAPHAASPPVAAPPGSHNADTLDVGMQQEDPRLPGFQQSYAELANTIPDMAVLGDRPHNGQQVNLSSASAASAAITTVQSTHLQVSGELTASATGSLTGDHRVPEGDSERELLLGSPLNSPCCAHQHEAAAQHAATPQPLPPFKNGAEGDFRAVEQEEVDPVQGSAASPDVHPPTADGAWEQEGERPTMRCKSHAAAGRRRPRAAALLYRGVQWSRRAQRWKVKVPYGRRDSFLPDTYSDIEEAALAYDAAVLQRSTDPRFLDHYLNFPFRVQADGEVAGAGTPASATNSRKRRRMHQATGHHTARAGGIEDDASGDGPFPPEYVSSPFAEPSSGSSGDEDELTPDAARLCRRGGTHAPRMASAMAASPDLSDNVGIPCGEGEPPCQACEEIQGDEPVHSPRTATPRQFSSRFRGVTKMKNNMKRKWKAQIHLKGTTHFFGFYEEEEEAARAYDLGVLRLLGGAAHARLNFPASMDKLPDAVEDEVADGAAPPTGKRRGYRGVHKDRSRWRAVVYESGDKKHYVGKFGTEEEAARAHDRAALQLFGTAARLNFPASNYQHPEAGGSEDDANDDRDVLRASPEYRPVSSPSAAESPSGRISDEDEPARPTVSLSKSGIACPDRTGSATFTAPDSSCPRRFHGVHKHGTKWRARIRLKGTYHTFGMYEDQEEAARAYDRGVLRLLGSAAHARLHFPPCRDMQPDAVGGSEDDGPTSPGSATSPSVTESSAGSSDNEEEPTPPAARLSKRGTEHAQPTGSAMATTTVPSYDASDTLSPEAAEPAVPCDMARDTHTSSASHLVAGQLLPSTPLARGEGAGGAAGTPMSRQQLAAQVHDMCTSQAALLMQTAASMRQFVSPTTELLQQDLDLSAEQLPSASPKAAWTANEQLPTTLEASSYFAAALGDVESAAKHLTSASQAARQVLSGAQETTHLGASAAGAWLPLGDVMLCTDPAASGAASALLAAASTSTTSPCTILQGSTQRGASPLVPVEQADTLTAHPETAAMLDPLPVRITTAQRSQAHRPYLEEFTGCVRSMPRARGGEMSVLGFTLHPAVAERFRRHLHAGKGGVPQVRVEPLGTEQDDQWWKDHKLNRDRVMQSVQRMIQRNMQNGTYLPQALPEQHVEAFTIPDDDPRVALRGQQGLRMTKKCYAGTVIGPYSSYVLPLEQYRQFRVTPQDNWTGTPPAWEMAVESYCVDDMEWKDEGMQLHYSAYGHGCLTAKVNDPHIDPGNTRNSSKVGDDNSCIRFFRVNTLPLPFLMLCSTVPSSGEVLYCYGRQYWDLMLELGMRCDVWNSWMRQHTIGRRQS